MSDYSIVDQLAETLGDKTVPQVLGELPDRSLLEAFFALRTNPGKIQKLVLMDILDNAKSSKIGIKQCFSEMTSVDSFREKMPITEYDDYRAYIEPLEAGEQNLLFHGDTVRFIATSGTTGIAKLLPESQAGEKAKAVVSRIRFLLLLTLAKEVMIPERKVLSITNSAEYGTTKSGIPIGSASGQAVKDVPMELLKKLVLPPEFIMAKDLDTEASDYLTLLFALSEPELAGVICSNIAHFDILLKKGMLWKDQLLKDMETGSISAHISMPDDLRKTLAGKLASRSDRAKILRQLLQSQDTMPVEEVWKNFTVVSCWMSSSSQRIVEDIRTHLPTQVKFLEWGYGASEGKFNIPASANDPSGDLALFGYFFEFLPLGATETLLAHQLEEGGYYELIVTSYSGLYRYNMKDIVYVKALVGQSPQITFVAKASERLKIQGIEIPVFQLEQGVNGASRQMQQEVRFYQVMAEPEKNHILFIVEPRDEEFDSEKYREYLETSMIDQSAEYKLAREKGLLNPVAIAIEKQGYRDMLFGRSIMSGKNVNQTKLKIIIEERTK